MSKKNSTTKSLRNNRAIFIGERESLRNFLSKISKQIQPEAIKLLRKVFAAESKERALEEARELSKYLQRHKREQVADWLEEKLEEALGVYELPQEEC